MRLPVRHWPDPVLLKPCQPWRWDTGREVMLEKCLTDTLLAEDALGLAANQIGEPVRVMAINSRTFGSIVIMYNPEITYSSPELETGAEGCLSFPRIELEIPRSKHVSVSWLDRYQYRHSCDYRGIDARCVQHELDHLNGRVFKDHVSSLKFSRAQQRASRRS